MTATTGSPNSDPPPKRTVRSRTALSAAVSDRARILQRLSLDDVPSAVRTLAVLRRGAGSAPGAVPDIWQDTIGLLPEDLLGRGDTPSPAECAVHHAMTLFALHRQGRVERAHVDGTAPGAAFARLAFTRGGEGNDDEGVRRRFDALITASTTAEAAHYLRGLILLARSADVGLDYGELAQDLADLWTPRRRDRVRLQWARQYRGIRSATQDVGADSASETPSDPISQEQ